MHYFSIKKRKQKTTSQALEMFFYGEIRKIILELLSDTPPLKTNPLSKCSISVI